jgi:hypothetical protein
MDISKIAKRMEGKRIEEVQVVYGEDILILTVSDEGEVFNVEIVVDSIYLEDE